MEEINKGNIKREFIKGSRRWSNYLWFTVLLFGGLGFLVTGISSYLHTQILPFGNALEINFFPQGIVMTFYGSFSFFLSLYVILTILWDVGAGYNEYNKNEKIIRIFRKGFPGKNRNFALTYSFQLIKAIKVSIQGGFNSKQTIYLLTKDNREIPISYISQVGPLSLEILEQKATQLALFLEVDLEWTFLNF
uniref:Photosystem I assembly protein Ycf4 n=1 Tax=Olisthodiscus luteus TaxID=83000 RepID=A0A7U0KT38_OLILU|nr:photosystem I assembly protein ycf4 [Olisthodiscus luteus]QQW50535.1 photosystem I assembly protein ycf4 [Olisthodiscus luteus]